MQRSVALFATLAIGFGAVQAQAAAIVKSVEVTSTPGNVVASGDSGDVVGIDQTFTVKAVVQDFTPADNDAVIFYLIRGGDSTMVVSDVDGGKNSGDDPDPDVPFGTSARDPADTAPVEANRATTPTPLSTVVDGAVGGDPLAADFGAPTSGFIVAFTRRDSAEADGVTLNDADTKIDAFVGKHVGDGDYIRVEGSDEALKTRKAETTYVWQGKIHHSSGTLEQIRVAVLVEDWEDIPDELGDDDTTTDVVETDHVVTPGGEELIAAFDYAGTDPRSPTSDEFNIDADRPANPAGPISGILLEELNEDGEFKALADLGDDATKAGGLTGATGDLHVGGIGDRLSLSVKVGPARAAEIADDHSLVVTIHEKKLTDDQATRAIDVYTFKYEIEAEDFGNVVDTEVPITAHIVDAAGNTSCRVNTSPDVNTEVTAQKDVCAAAATTEQVVLNGITPGDDVDFRLDATAPDATKDSLLVVEGSVAKKLPAKGDTLTDGTINPEPVSDDLNALFYNVPEALSKLEIIIKDPGADDKTGTNLTVSSTEFGSDALGKPGTAQRVEFKFVAAGAAGADPPNPGTASVGELTGPGSGKEDADGNDYPAFADGMKSVKVTAVDLAGNAGPSQEYSVYMDASDVTFDDHFPEAGIPRLGPTTAVVRFSLSEQADSVLISYTEVVRAGGTAKDEDSPREATLTEADLETPGRNLDVTVDGLVDEAEYELSLLGADLAGNYARVVIDTFLYDKEHEEPAVASFKIISAPDAPKGGTGDDAMVAAGTIVELTITAHGAPPDDAEEGTLGPRVWDYAEDVVLTILRDGTVKFDEEATNQEAVESDPASRRLLAKGWSVGKRNVKFTPETSPASHRAQVVDASDADNVVTSLSDSVFVIEPATKFDIVVDAPDAVAAAVETDPDTVAQGEDFMVQIALADTFGNVRAEDAGFVEITTPSIGVQLPSGGIAVTKGVASFMANSATHSGPLTITAREVAGGSMVVREGTTTPIAGALTVYVKAPEPEPPPEPPPPPTAPDAPDTLFAQDYKGALGTGDQGGFVMLTWDASDDHSELSGYRIYRQLHVNVLEDQTGAGKLMLADDSEAVDVPWARVDAVPGEGVMRAVVATLDGYATKYGVSAERQGLRSFPPTTHPDLVGGMVPGEDDGMADDGMADDGMADDAGEDTGGEDGTDTDGTDTDGTDTDGTDTDGTDTDGTDTDGTDDGTDTDGTDDGTDTDGTDDGTDGGTDTGGTDDGTETGTSTKRAFTVTQVVSEPYELMAETMIRSREAAEATDPAGPVFATLTPEALAYGQGARIPSFKTAEMERSEIRRTLEEVAATDDLPPAPVPFLRVLDTPGDAGSSISIQWSGSADDRLISVSVPQATGENSVFTTPGVQGYKISRRIGEGPWQVVGEAPAGARSFNDETALNGVRYVYKVEAFDMDNQTPSELIGSAMAIRNKVVDGEGNPVIGLFGADNRVDFDDFFIFADHFGLTAEDETFDSAFDLVVNNAVDLADFFAFAANFGREVEGIGKVVPTLVGLNTEARFRMDHGGALPAIGEELVLRVSVEDYQEVRGYGLTVAYDHEALEFVETRIVDNPLGEAVLAHPQSVVSGDGEVSIAAFGETVAEGDIEIGLVFMPTREIEEGYIELSRGGMQDGSYGLNRMSSPIEIRIETRPEIYALENNYPNPFNPETTIKYQLPEAGEVTLEVYNMLGQVVRTLVDREFQSAGRYNYQWDATNDSGHSLSSGVYFFRITAGGEFQSHKRMLLLK